jgi:hypothetical protein
MGSITNIQRGGGKDKNNMVFLLPDNQTRDQGCIKTIVDSGKLVVVVT